MKGTTPQRSERNTSMEQNPSLAAHHFKHALDPARTKHSHTTGSQPPVDDRCGEPQGTNPGATWRFTEEQNKKYTHKRCVCQLGCSTNSHVNGRDLVDSASSHMLVSRTKPCTPQNHCTAGICAWLITSDVICRKDIAVKAVLLDTLAKRQANT